MRGLTQWLPTLLAAALLAEPAAADLTPYKAQYQVKISMLGGKLYAELNRTDDGYKATHLIKPSGLASALTGGGEILAESEFRPTDGGLEPIRYRGNDEISKEKLRVDIAFDWDEQRATGTYQTKEDPAPVDVNDELDMPAHDAVSIQYELMSDFANGGVVDEYVLYEHDKIRKLKVTHIGEQTMSTKAGTYEVVGIRHQAENSSRATTLWLAKELDYVPLVIERHRKGKLQMRAKLVSYEPDE